MWGWSVQYVWALHFFYWPFQGSVSFVGPFCCLCFMFVIVVLSCLFLATLWSSDVGRELTPCVWRCLVFLLLSHMVFQVQCGIQLYRFLIFALILLLPIYSAIFFIKSHPKHRLGVQISRSQCFQVPKTNISHNNRCFTCQYFFFYLENISLYITSAYIQKH